MSRYQGTTLTPENTGTRNVQVASFYLIWRRRPTIICHKADFI